MTQGSDRIEVISGDDKVHILILHKKRFWLLLLLLLMLLAMLIPVRRDVPLQLATEDTDLAVALTDVDFSYPSHWPYSGEDPVTLRDVTDTLGRVIFHKITRPLWAELFCWHDTATVSAQNQCHTVVFSDNIDNYPRDDYKTISLHPIRERLVFIVEDGEYNEPLPDVTVKAYVGSEILTLTTDASGAVEIIAPVCDNIKVVAEKEYFKPDSTSGIVESFVIGDVTSRTLKLRPKYGAVIIIVRDLSDHEPLPGAMVTLHANNSMTKASTNVKGIAIAVFPKIRENGDIIFFDAQKQNYADTTLPRNTAEFYINDATVNQRTMYLRPLKKMLTFINTDGRDRLQGVTNKIYVNGQLVATVISNSNGCFSYAFNPEDIISIVSSKPGYRDNFDKVKNVAAGKLADIDSRTIPLSKILPEPPRKIISVCDAGEVMPKGPNEMYHAHQYRMGKKGGTATMELDFYSEFDYLTIYDGKDVSSFGKVIIGRSDKGVTVGNQTLLQNNHTITFDFQSDVITIVITTSSNTSTWKYKVNCPK